MRMKIMLGSVFSMCVAVFLFGCVSLSDTGDRYHAALNDIKEGRPTFALLNLKLATESDKSSAYAPQAKFAVGEYYFDVADYFDAMQTFSDYLRMYPKDKGAIFAKLLVYKILSEFRDNKGLDASQEELIKEIRKELFSKPLFLIFYDKKAPRVYRSLFKNTYLVYDYVDKIRVLRNDKIFLELSP